VTALICLSDQLAIGAIEAATSTGRIVPDDLSVVGFDGTHTTGTDGLTLTTIGQPHEEKGRTAARLLLAAMRGDASKPVMLPHELIVGTSVTPVG
jgi:DNA-binding LacI/PurR family transcriptional regulator